MFLVGHAAMAYLLGAAAGRGLGIRPKIPLLVLLSFLPDLDSWLGATHRGPTHSLLTLTLIGLVAFVFFKRSAVPYAAALYSHPLADYAGGGLQLLWPLTTQDYGVGFSLFSLESQLLELGAVLAAIALLISTGDYASILRASPRNLILAPVSIALLGSLFLAVSLDAWLVVPVHLVFLVFLAASSFISLRVVLASERGFHGIVKDYLLRLARAVR